MRVKSGEAGGGGAAFCLRVPTLVSYFFFFGNNNYFKSCACRGNTFLRPFKSIRLLSSTLLWCCCYAVRGGSTF